MPGKMAGSDPRPSVRITRGGGSGQHLASVLQEGRENANIDAGLGFIWRISVHGSLPRDNNTHRRGRAKRSAFKAELNVDHRSGRSQATSKYRSDENSFR